MGESFQKRYKQVKRQDAENIITEYLKPVFGFALKRCKTMHDAEDLSQEIILRAFRALLCKDDIESYDKFIWTVAHNALSNYYRESARSIIGVPIDEAADVIGEADLSLDDACDILMQTLNEYANTGFQQLLPPGKDEIDSKLFENTGLLDIIRNYCGLTV